MAAGQNGLPTPLSAGALPGVDVSSFQGPPGDWVTVAGDIDWAAVKLTELQPTGVKYVNPDAPADWDWLHAHKKGRIAYLFGHPSTSPTETVDLFIGELTTVGLQDSDGVALDLEVTDGLSAAAVSSWARTVQSQLHSRLGRNPLLYTFRDFAAEGNTAGLAAYPLWIADPSSPAGHPQVPAPWTTWAIHQYDISGDIDRDVANYANLADMAAALGKSSKEPPDVNNLGGDLVSGVTTGRWSDGRAVVAGLGADGYIQSRRFDGGWGAWGRLSPTKAMGVPTVTVDASDGRGWLYYLNDSNEVIQLVTRDYGRTWA
jgi:lysozyme